jgi:hypothetical protein
VVIATCDFAGELIDSVINSILNTHLLNIIKQSQRDIGMSVHNPNSSEIQRVNNFTEILESKYVLIRLHSIHASVRDVGQIQLHGGIIVMLCNTNQSEKFSITLIIPLDAVNVFVRQIKMECAVGERVANFDFESFVGVSGIESNHTYFTP